MLKNKKKSRLIFCAIIAICLISVTPTITGLYLNDLEDVTITDIYNNQYIKYNSTSANWTNQNVTFGNPFNQNLNTTDNVNFNWVTANSFFGDGGNLTNITGVGGNPFNQNLNTTDNVTFNNITVGSGSDYLTVNETGFLTLHGDAMVTRHVRVIAPQWVKGAEAPTDSLVNIFPTLIFDSLHDDYAYFSLIVPWRIEEGSNITVSIDWCVLDDVDGYVIWALEYLSVSEYDGDSAGILIAAPEFIIQDSVEGITGSRLIRTVFEDKIEGAIAHDDLGLRLIRLSSEDTIEQDVHLIQVHFEFIEDKLGGYING